MLQTTLSSLASGLALAVTGSGIIDSSAAQSNVGVTDIYANNASFTSRDEALNAAAIIAELYDSIVSYCDSKSSKDLFVKTGEGFEQMSISLMNAQERYRRMKFITG